MNIYFFIYLSAGISVVFILGLFLISTLSEKKQRASVISIIITVLFCAVWFGGVFSFRISDTLLLVLTFAVATAFIAFFLPMGRKKQILIKDFDGKVDERDTMFAREEYTEGSEKYAAYYSKRPENRIIDDKIRRMPELLQSGGRYYDNLRSGYISSLFDVQSEFVSFVDGAVNENRIDRKPDEFTKLIKTITIHLGAQEVGIANLDQRYVYSHVGRGPESWGSVINNSSPYAIMFSVEMDYFMVEEAPGIGITEETALQYLNVQKISIALAQYIRRMGYSARAHVAGSNYQLMLPPVAYDAGLGELGRLGYLISPKYGARTRLGAVTTDMPLIPDKPVMFGVLDFCEKCKKCAENCPSGAIPPGERAEVRGVEKWPLHIEKCIQYWRHIGTDCGLCMKVCPFSHPGSFVHRLIKEGVRRSTFARTVSAYSDDLFYGKRVRL